MRRGRKIGRGNKQGKLHRGKKVEREREGRGRQE